MSQEKSCAFCVLVWQLYAEAKKDGIPFELPNSEQYIQRHMRNEHNLILVERITI